MAKILQELYQLGTSQTALLDKTLSYFMNIRILEQGRIAPRKDLPDRKF